MTHYLTIENNKIIGASQCPCINEDIQNIEVTEELYNSWLEDKDKYVYQDGKMVENPNYKEIKKQKEQEQINNLTMTAQDLLDMIHSLGVSWDSIDDYLNTHKELKLRLTTCQNVFCGVLRQLLPLKIDGAEITDEMVVRAFEIKNSQNIN